MRTAPAMEIKTLIRHSVGKADLGSRLVTAAGDTMNEVLASATRVTDIMDGRTLAGQEPRAGIAPAGARSCSRRLGQAERHVQRHARA